MNPWTGIVRPKTTPGDPSPGLPAPSGERPLQSARDSPVTRWLALNLSPVCHSLAATPRVNEPAPVGVSIQWIRPTTQLWPAYGCLEQRGRRNR
jgi:hypothetical protein